MTVWFLSVVWGQPVAAQVLTAECGNYLSSVPCVGSMFGLSILSIRTVLSWCQVCHSNWDLNKLFFSVRPGHSHQVKLKYFYHDLTVNISPASHIKTSTRPSSMPETSSAFLRLMKNLPWLRLDFYRSLSRYNILKRKMFKMKQISNWSVIYCYQRITY